MKIKLWVSTDDFVFKEMCSQCLAHYLRHSINGSYYWHCDHRCLSFDFDVYAVHHLFQGLVVLFVKKPSGVWVSLRISKSKNQGDGKDSH